MPLRRPHILTRLFAPALLALALAGGVGCSPQRTGEGYTLVTAEVGALEITLEELGIVEATRVLGVETPFSGRLISIMESGTLVRKGDVVAVLDTRDIEDRLEDQVESLKGTQKQLEQTIEQLMISLRNNLLDVSAAQAQLDLARVQLENVNLNLADLEYLHSQELIADDNLRDAASSMRRTQIQTLTQDLGLRSQVTGTVSTEKTQEVRIERIGLTGRETIDRINQSNDRIEMAQVRSPVDGMFLRHSRWNWQVRRNMERQSGETVGESEPLGRIPDLSSLVVLTQVPESEMLRVRRGLPVELSFEALGNLRLTGEITYIAPMAIERETAPGGQASASGDQISGERVFEAQVTLRETDERLKPGLTARARIQLERTDNLLLIPLEAVETRNGVHTVKVMTEGRPETRVITVGRSNRTRVEVLSGISRGDRLVVQGG